MDVVLVNCNRHLCTDIIQHFIIKLSKAHSFTHGHTHTVSRDIQSRNFTHIVSQCIAGVIAQAVRTYVRIRQSIRRRPCGGRSVVLLHFHSLALPSHEYQSFYCRRTYDCCMLAWSFWLASFIDGRATILRLRHDDVCSWLALCELLFRQQNFQAIPFHSSRRDDDVQQRGNNRGRIELLASSSILPTYLPTSSSACHKPAHEDMVYK